MTTDTITVGHETLAFRVTGEDSGGALAVLEVRMPPGGGPPMLHRHDAFEAYRVDSGELAFYLESEGGEVTRTVAGPGSVVAIPGGREHTIRNESGAEAEALVVFTPGAEMEAFAREAGALADPGPADAMAVAAAHGIEITRGLEGIA